MAPGAPADPVEPGGSGPSIPAWTDEERRSFAAQVEALRARQLRAGRVFAAAVAGIVAAGVILRLPEVWWVSGVGVVALAGLVFRLALWTCPRCGERLPSRGARRICLGCGGPLE